MDAKKDMASKTKAAFQQSNVFLAAVKMLEDVRKETDTAIVSFSGGKDSLACMELAVRTFRHVVALFMYSVPGLSFIEEQLDILKTRWPQVPLVRYPHWWVLGAIKDGLYRATHWKLSEAIPEVSVIDIYKIAMFDLKIPVLINGGKEADSMWRRRAMTVTAKNDDIIYPLAKWNKFDVMAFLTANKIPIPKASADSKSTISGVDLSTPSVLWMHDNYYEDFLKLEALFPYCRAIVKRREWFGVQ